MRFGGYIWTNIYLHLQGPLIAAFPSSSGAASGPMMKVIDVQKPQTKWWKGQWVGCFFTFRAQLLGCFIEETQTAKDWNVNEEPTRPTTSSLIPFSLRTYNGQEVEACSLSLKGSKWTSLVFHYRPFHPSFKDTQAPPSTCTWGLPSFHYYYCQLFSCWHDSNKDGTNS